MREQRIPPSPWEKDWIKTEEDYFNRPRPRMVIIKVRGSAGKSERVNVRIPKKK